MKKRYLSILPLLGLALASCVDAQGAVFIEGFVPYDDDCKIDPENDERVYDGLLDIGGLPQEANGYEAPAVVVSNLMASVDKQGGIQQERQRQPNYPSYGPSDSNVVIFEKVRVYFTDDRGNELNVAGVTADKRRETPVGSAVYQEQQGGGQASKAAVLAPLITREEALSLQTLSTPDLANSPGLAELSGDPNRRFRIVANVQVLGKTTGGANVVSEEFGFPIDLCQRCLTNVGMPAGQAECAPGQTLVEEPEVCAPGQDVLTSRCQ